MAAEISGVVKVNLRRGRLLVAGAAVATAPAAFAVIHDGELGAPPQTVRGTVPWEEGVTDAPPEIAGTDFEFFTDEERVFIEAAIDQDSVLNALEKNELPLGDGMDGKMFFDMLLQNTKEGYFPDPIYGGNGGMGAWKMIGFPGAHYDYLEWVGRHLIHLILGGTHVGTSPSRSTPLSMPSFAWKLSEAEIADVATFIRNSWGNRASPVDADQVHDLRSRLGLNTIHYTANSGDQP